MLSFVSFYGIYKRVYAAIHWSSTINFSESIFCALSIISRRTTMLEEIEKIELIFVPCSQRVFCIFSFFLSFIATVNEIRQRARREAGGAWNINRRASITNIAVDAFDRGEHLPMSQRGV